MDRSDLANRMKDYEKRNRYYLQRRMPVIIRLDMRAGHTFTKGFKRPFDEVFMKSMQETAKYLCENIQNTKIAYTQSDEITLVLVDYDKLNTEPFFEYRVDKLCSIAASMATMAFNKFFEINANSFIQRTTSYTWKHKSVPLDDDEAVKKLIDESKKEVKLLSTYENAIEKGAMFDARVFNIPKEEVTNCIYWRQLDASRNSVQMVGQANFSHKELQNKSCSNIQDMLMEQKGINWNDFPTYQKRGTCVIKEEYLPYEPAPGYENCEINAMDYRTRWIIDKEIPIFKNEGREYIEKLINF